MILRLTKKMMKKIHEDVDVTLGPVASPLCDWGLNLFQFGRVPYIIATDAASLYTVLLYGRGITDDQQLIRLLGSRLQECHRDMGLAEAFERVIGPSLNTVTFSQMGNPSLMGSMNDRVHAAKALLADYDASPAAIRPAINRAPMKALGYAFPVEVHRDLCQAAH